jgi:hypothetical protein
VESIFNNTQASRIIWHKIKNNNTLVRFTLENMVGMTTVPKQIGELQALVEREYLYLDNCSIISKMEQNNLSQDKTAVKIKDYISSIEHQLNLITLNRISLSHNNPDFSTNIDSKHFKMLILNFAYVLSEITKDKNEIINLESNYNKVTLSVKHNTNKQGDILQLLNNRLIIDLDSTYEELSIMTYVNHKLCEINNMNSNIVVDDNIKVEILLK